MSVHHISVHSSQAGQKRASYSLDLEFQQLWAVIGGLEVKPNALEGKPVFFSTEPSLSSLRWALKKINKIYTLTCSGLRRRMKSEGTCWYVRDRDRLGIWSLLWEFPGKWQESWQGLLTPDGWGTQTLLNRQKGHPLGRAQWFHPNCALCSCMSENICLRHSQLWGP